MRGEGCRETDGEWPISVGLDGLLYCHEGIKASHGGRVDDNDGVGRDMKATG